MKNITKVLAASVLLAITTLTLAGDEMPWAFNNGDPGEGYSIALESISPAPGTPLVVGQSVPFKVIVRYENKVAPVAQIFLVFQTKNGQVTGAGGAQVKREVTDKSGTVTLEDTLVIPKKAKELMLFIPVMPEGLKETTGEMVVRWPIKKK